MAEPIFIQELISKINDGNIRIPSFQRGFVWDVEKVAHLMDSIYKGFPFGALLFWRTKNPLKTERQLGPYQLPERDPDYPVDYILDGQQRATSIFGVFQSNLTPVEGEDESVFRIYFDLTQDSTVQDSNFIYVPDAEVDPKRHFPLRLLFDPPSYRRYLRSMDEDIAEIVDRLYARFTTARIPVQTFTTDDRTAVAIVFERINRLGVELDTLQLLSAWTWSEDFDLQEEFQQLAEDLEPFGFKDVGEDSDLLLRCCAAILKGEASPNTIVTLNGEEVRTRFPEIRRGINGAVDFLRTNLQVYSTTVLPFPTVIIPLSVFFASSREQAVVPTGEQSELLQKWLWRTFFTRRYSKRLEQLNTDVSEINKLKSGKPSSLGEFSIEFDGSYFSASTFNLNTVNTKAFVLLLANEVPLSFVSGAKIQMQPVLEKCNKKEFHHLFPRSFLAGQGIAVSQVNSLTNIAFLPRGENNKLGGDRPSVYRQLMPRNEEAIRLILKSALCPECLFEDDFHRFEEERKKLLTDAALRLMKLT